MDPLNESLLGKGAGRTGLLTAAFSAIRKGFKLDPVPLKKHDEVFKKEFREKFGSAVNDLSRTRNFDKFNAEVHGLFQLYITRSYVMGADSVRGRPVGLNDRDFDRIQSRVAKQLQFARKFGSDVLNGNTRIPIDRRVEMYLASLDEAFQVGATGQLKPNVLIYWRLNPAEHCLDCIRLSEGGPYTRDEIAIISPRSGHTACRANCRCTLEITTRFKATVSRLFAWPLKRA